MKVLMVGAGALGQVFGLWLTRGGASVTYLVRPGREEWGEDGRTLFRLRRLGRPVAGRLRPDAVRTETVCAEAPGAPGDAEWDAIWLCVPSPALHEPWVRALRDRTAPREPDGGGGGDDAHGRSDGGATIVTIGQDPRDLPALARIWPRERIVQVVPSVLAHPAPRTDEVPSAGIAYWQPPGTAHTVWGTRDRARPVVAALRAAGVRTRGAGRAGTAELGAARMIPYMAALEIAGWSLPALRSGLTAPTAAAHEATAVTAALLHRAPPRLPVPAWAAWLVLRALPVLAPFDLPRYLRAHFGKVGPQTREMLDAWITEGASRGLPVSALKELRGALKP
ncbi:MULTISPECIES: ketopantoate reductase family protein [unclassified Streptomyces]|uniref:ketopantoate reductase family protein n=1 Tax=unclassified Streptomyces TaxID=2593676 RepID=UPI002E295B6E|nr:hypothetical protein [Streptomyces sp. NBC_01429]